MRYRIAVPVLGLVLGTTLFVSSGVSSLPVDPAEEVTLSELARRLEACADCPHVVYVWSPSMPLSRLGIEEAATATRELGVPLSVLPASELLDPAAPETTAGEPAGDPGGGRADDLTADDLAEELARAGALVHFPTMVLFRGVEARGNALAGYKRAEGYRRLLVPRLRELDGPVPPPAPVGPPSGRRQVASPAPRDLEVVWRHAMRNPPGAFFRRVPGTSFISYDRRERVFLLDLETNRTYEGPGFIDFVPSPDGRLFVTPVDRHDGLEFYLVDEVLRQARAGAEKEDYRVIHLDPEMDDQYPTVGILSEDPDGAWTNYRVLISWFSGLVFRDYRVTWRPNDATVEPLTAAMQACPDKNLSLPIMSRDGREIAARYERGGGMRVFGLADDGSCSQILDLDRQTSKVAFSPDGSRIAFSSRARPERGSPSHTYVLDRETMETVQVPESESQGLVIPDFASADSLLYLVQRSRPERVIEFRMACCMN